MNQGFALAKESEWILFWALIIMWPIQRFY